MRTMCLFVLLVGCEPAADTPQKTDTGTPGDDSGEAQEETGTPTTDRDGDGFTDDCDDNNPDIFPGAAEICDGLDNDCNNLVDDDPVDDTLWFEDRDSDGYGNPDESEWACDQPDGWVTNDLDCDDTSALYNPSAIESDCEDPTDYNCDGSVGYADADGDGYAACADCDDDDADVHPDADETCNDTDDDCDGLVDADDPDLSDGTTYHGDSDGDGYGGQQYEAVGCAPPPGYVENTDDCDDLEAATFPGAAEICDNEDNDCDGTVDEGVGFTWYADTDGDGYGDASSVATDCDMPPGYSANGDDCNDNVASTNPAAFEVCDGVDNDCDGTVDGSNAINASTWYADSDNDGYGNPTQSSSGCTAPTGYVADFTDCDDSDNSTHPSADEVCDSADNDCDGTTDEDDATDATTWYADLDGDGYGSASSSQAACNQPAATVTDNTDCNDLDSTIHPGGTETCDAANNDEDCDGAADDADSGGATGTTLYFPDVDGDGFGDQSDSGTAYCDNPGNLTTDNSDCDDSATGVNVNPNATETWYDGVDSDCDGASDYDADSDGYDSNQFAGTDCDDTNPASTTLATDADCDGTLTADDCDDTNSTSTILATDADCDGTLTADDCDDANSTSTILATDGDCDGVLTADDCNDSDATVYESGSTQTCPATNCLAILNADSTKNTGSYWISPSGSTAVQLYCDMTAQDGGWTLVYRNSESDRLSIRNAGAQNTGNLVSLSGGTGKLADSTINALLSQAGTSLIGYRITSNNTGARYYSPSNCTYSHTTNGSTNACRQFTATYSSTSPAYIQCSNWGGDSGGLDAWYDCNGGGYTNVFTTHRGNSRSCGMTNNTNGSSNGGAWTTYGNDVLMWVR